MTKLSTKTRDEARILLDQHADITDALQKVSKKNFDAGISLNNDDDDSDYLSVTVTREIAAVALEAQRKVIIQKLAKLGIQIS